jgi:hypothetical protein
VQQRQSIKQQQQVPEHRSYARMNENGKRGKDKRSNLSANIRLLRCMLLPAVFSAAPLSPFSNCT